MFRLLLEAAPDGVVVVERGGRIALVNRRAEELFGYSREELVGRPVELLVPAHLGRAHAEHRARYESAPRLRPMGGGLVLHGRRKDGSEFLAEIQLSPMESETGLLVICSVRDLSEGAAMVEALRDGEERLRLALEAGRLGCFEHDLRTDEVRCSGALLELLGREGESLATVRDFLGLVHPDDRPVLARAVAEELGRGVVEDREFRVLAADGSARWVSRRGRLVRDREGTLVRTVGVGADITARKEAELQLRAHLRRQERAVELGNAALAGTPLSVLFEQAAETVAEGLNVEYAKVLELRPDGSFLLRAGVGWAPGLVGQATVPAEAGSQAGYTLLSSQPIVVCDLAEETRFSAPQLLLDHGVRSGVSVAVEGRDGPFGVLGAHSARRRRFAEHDVGFLQTVALVLSEAIKRQAVEEELHGTIDRLRASDEERRRLLESLVHAQEEERRRISTDIHDDTVQVITALALRLDVLRERLHDESLRALADEAASTARASIVRLRRLVFDLHPPALEREGLGAALRPHLEELRREQGLAYELDDRLGALGSWEMRAIAYRIAREALANVAKHAHAARVEVSLEAAEGGIAVRIRDDGRGFVPEEVEQGDLGLHLGLTSMRRRAEMAGGRLTIDSSPGAGTLVTLSLPGPPSSSGRAA